MEIERNAKRRRVVEVGDEDSYISDGTHDSDVEGFEADDDDDDDEDNDAAVFAKYSWHLDMINDHIRNSAFHKAIVAAVNTKNEELRNAQDRPRVLDIGTGSGLLALLAARAGASTVTCVEADPVLAEMAEQNVLRNHLSDTIAVISGHSTQISEPSHRFDVLVAEVLDSGLLGEDFLPTLRHAWSTLLTPDAIVVPANATVHAQLVQSSTLHSWQHLDVEQLNVRTEIQTMRGPASPSPCSVHFDRLLATGHASVLSEPFPVFEFDFVNLPREQGRRLKIGVTATADGFADAIVFWWNCFADQAGKHCVSTAPGQHDVFRDHWRQAVCVLPRREKISRGAVVSVVACHNDFDCWFEVGDAVVASLDNAVGDDEEQDLSVVLHNVCDSDRLWMCSDHRRLQPFQNALRRAIDTGAKSVLDIGDGALLPLLAMKEGAASVTSLESSEESAELTQELVEASSAADQCQTSVHLGLPDDLDMVDVICAEPFFERTARVWAEGSLLLFWDQCNALVPTLLKPEGQLMPCRATLMGAIVECPSLWSIRRPVNGLVCGVDLSSMNSLYSADRIDSVQMWQFEHKLLSRATPLLHFNMKDTMSSAQADVLLPCVEDGTSHILVVWIEFSLDELSSVNTGPLCKSGRSFDATAYFQGVRLCRMPQKISEGASMSVWVDLDAENVAITAGIGSRTQPQ